MQHNLTAEYKTLLAEARTLQQRLDVLPTGYISKKRLTGKIIIIFKAENRAELSAST